ncbi:aconitase iron-sulfur domain-containing protein, partial [Neocallimastix californiae]
MIIGADSHSCSAGALGKLCRRSWCWLMFLCHLVTGETWFKVPETCEIRFVVCDDRFAIANMSTEFGGIAGVFQADEITANFIAKRTGEDANYKEGALYFRADEGAQYSSSHIIDLSKVEPSVFGELVGMDLDGVFIGACTTAEEELILAGLVLEAGLKKGYVPVCKGTRKVTPGSASILARLRELGLIDVYEKAGFQVGAPGCSYCLGIAADRAGEGEVWFIFSKPTPRALKGSGVKCVIARSYAFIYGRNQYNMALYGIIINDDAFYEIATEDKEIYIDIPNRYVEIE